MSSPSPPNESKENQINPNKKLGFPWSPLAESGLINGLSRIQIKKSFESFLLAAERLACLSFASARQTSDAVRDRLYGTRLSSTHLTAFVSSDIGRQCTPPPVLRKKLSADAASNEFVRDERFALPPDDFLRREGGVGRTESNGPTDRADRRSSRAVTKASEIQTRFSSICAREAARSSGR
jgi:hypothetical protein